MKSRFHTGAVWLEALLDFDNELDEHVGQAMKDQLRFQDGRLFRSLKRHIKAKATGKDEWYALFYCYRFMTDTLPHPGYDEARRLHGEEMEARGLLSAREFCSSLVESLDELLLRVRSIASWIEAQKSFSLWLVFRNLQSGWRGERDERDACDTGLLFGGVATEMPGKDNAQRQRTDYGAFPGRRRC